MDTAPKVTLKIRWKRLVVGPKNETAPQHAGTEAAVDSAFALLEKSLAPLGVEVTLEKAALSKKKFDSDPLQSNRIWINGAALEMHLPNAKPGQIEIESSGAVFRTVEYAGRSFRDIPADLIVQAGLIAAADSAKQVLAEVHVLATAGNGKAGTPMPGTANPGTAKEPAKEPAKTECGKPAADCCKKPDPAATPAKTAPKQK